MQKPESAAEEPERTNAIGQTEFPTWLLVIAIYAGWIATLWNFEVLPWWLILPAGAWFVAWHNSFQHEALHGHPSRHRWLNSLLAWPPLCLWMPYPLYRDNHLAHHKTPSLTDPFDDPESYYLTAGQWQDTGPVGRAILTANNTLAGRMVFGPWLAAGSFWRAQFLAVARGDRRYLGVWLLHIAICAGMLFLLWRYFAVSPFEYIALFAWPGLALSLVRSFYEHRPAPNQDSRTAVVEAGALMSLLFLNNNLHVVHHDRPGMPWHALPGVFRRDRKEILSRASGFHFPGGYLQIARRYAFTPKDLPAHPG